MALEDLDDGYLKAAGSVVADDNPPGSVLCEAVGIRSAVLDLATDLVTLELIEPIAQDEFLGLVSELGNEQAPALVWVDETHITIGSNNDLTGGAHFRFYRLPRAAVPVTPFVPPPP